MKTYEKPKDVTYTEMAIWIDNNVYSGSFDIETCYKYLYLLCYMLTVRLGFFRYEKDIDEFSLFVATSLYKRLTNKKQFESKSDGTCKMEKITSILNYMKKVLPRYKYDFDIVFNGMPVEKDIEVFAVPSFDLDSYAAENTYIFDQLSPSFTFENLSGIVKQHLRKIPHKKDSSEWENIYISCILTLLNTVTLDRDQIRRLKTQKRDKRFLLDNLYKDLRHKPPILFHLEDSYENYILTLVNEIRDVLAAEITWTSGTQITNDTSIENILLDRYGGIGSDEYSE